MSVNVQSDHTERLDQLGWSLLSEDQEDIRLYECLERSLQIYDGQREIKRLSQSSKNDLAQWLNYLPEMTTLLVCSYGGLLHQRLDDRSRIKSVRRSRPDLDESL